MMRIGHGYDIHRFAEADGSPQHICLGGVKISHDCALEAHSDGDVLIHALCDALLGAAGLGDIGRHFPDTDAQFKDIDSGILLAEVNRQLQQRGFQLVNLDATIICQQPRLAPHIASMVKCLSARLAVDRAQINIKATTAEHLGALGRREGLAVHAVVLIESQ